MQGNEQEKIIEYIYLGRDAQVSAEPKTRWTRTYFLKLNLDKNWEVR